MFNKLLFLLLFFSFLININGQEICDNGLDDDGNGLTDCEEPSCYFSFASCACTNVDVIWALTTEKDLIWINLLTGEERLVGPTASGRDISWSPDGKLYIIDDVTKIININYNNGSTISTQSVGTGGDGMVVGDDGIFYYGKGEKVTTYDPSTGIVSLFTTITGYKCSGDLAFLNGKLLVALEKGVSGGGDSYVAIVDLATSTYTLVKLLTTLKQPFGMESNANGVVYISFNNKIYILNTTTGAITLKYTSSLTTRFSGLAILSKKCDCDYTATIFPTNNLCTNDTLFVAETASDPVTISWILPNGTTLVKDFVTPLVDGRYIVKVKTATCPEVKDTLDLVLGTGAAPFSLGKDTAYCGNFVRTLSTGNATTNWSNGSIGSTLTISNGGTYWAEVNGGCGTFRDSIIITQNPFPILNIGNDTSICQGTSLTLNATAVGATYLWSNGSTNATIVVNTQSTNTVTVTVNGCSAMDSRTLSFIPGATLFIGNDTSICGLFTKIISSGNNLTTWSNGQVGNSITVNQFGTYWGEINTSCGKIRDSIIISKKSNPLVNLGNDTSICAGSNLILNATNIGATYVWSTTETSPTITVNKEDQYDVLVTINGCESRDTINVTVKKVLDLFIGNDTAYCGDFSRLLTTGNTQTLWSNGVTGSSISVSSEGIYWAQINDGCITKRDSIFIKKNKIPIVNLGNDKSICKGDSVLLNAYNLNATYSWNTGNKDSSFYIFDAGTYGVVVSFNGCKASDSMELKVDEFPVFNLGNDSSLCGNVEVILSTGIDDTKWSNGAIGSSITAIQPGLYWAEIKNTCGITRDSIEFFSVSNPLIDLGTDKIICKDTILLNAYQADFVSYKWNVGSIDAVLTVTKPGLYFVLATDMNGCLAYDEVKISLDCKDEIFVPTAFSPNGDGINDVFQILADTENIKLVKLNVFNRWGEKVFDGSLLNPIWDGNYKGKPAPIDQYIWWVEYIALQSNETKTVKGTVVIVK